MKTLTRISLAVVLCLIMGGCAAIYPPGWYVEEGGMKVILPTGVELEIQSGATLDIQSGATTDFSGGIDLDGALLDLDADGDTSIQASTDDQIDIEISAADDFRFTANTFSALAGSSINLAATADIHADGAVEIGDGTPDGAVTAGTDETLYVESYAEFDAEVEFDGIIDADSTSDFADTATFSKGSGSAIAISAGGDIDLVATADINAYGFVTVGDGTPDGSVAAGTDEELYVEGDFEVDGTAEFDGAVEMDSTMTIAGTLTLEAGSDIQPASATNTGAMFCAENTVAYTDTSAKTLFVLPANVNIVDAWTDVSTVFNSDGTDLLNVGINAGDTDAYVDDLDGSATGVLRMGSGATMPAVSTHGDVGASNITIDGIYAAGGSAAGTGLMKVVICYIVD